MHIMILNYSSNFGSLKDTKASIGLMAWPAFFSQCKQSIVQLQQADTI